MKNNNWLKSLYRSYPMLNICLHGHSRINQGFLSLQPSSFFYLYTKWKLLLLNIKWKTYHSKIQIIEIIIQVASCEHLFNVTSLTYLCPMVKNHWPACYACPFDLYPLRAPYSFPRVGSSFLQELQWYFSSWFCSSFSLCLLQVFPSQKEN